MFPRLAPGSRHRDVFFDHALVVVTLLLSISISFGYNRLLKTYRDATLHTQRVITAIDQMQLQLRDAETGQRGFVITGDEAYLVPFESGRSAVAQSIDSIRLLASDNAEQIDRLEEIASLAERKAAELQATIALRRAQGFVAAQAAVAGNAGKEIMDRIRLVSESMRAREMSLLEERLARARIAERMMVGVAAACFALSFIGRLIGRRLEARGAK